MADISTLYLIPTLLAENTQHEVLSPLVYETIKNLNHFFVENERSARRFISSLSLGVAIDGLKLHKLDKNTNEEEIALIIKNFRENNVSFGVMSEAGCPGIADPGALAVGLAHKLGVKVVPLVGPSSLLLALMASGFNGQSFVFHGYLPIEKTQRQVALKKLERDAISKKQSQLFIETPYRNMALYADILQVCQPDTKLCVACDITTPTAVIKTLSVNDWKKTSIDLNKKPTVFIIG